MKRKHADGERERQRNRGKYREWGRGWGLLAGRGREGRIREGLRDEGRKKKVWV